MKTAKHPTFDLTLFFNEEKHLYGFGDENYTWEIVDRIPSVTQFVAHYTPEFDAEAIAAKVAGKQGRTVEEVKTEWEDGKNYACEFGTRVHANQEAMMTGNQPTSAPEDEREQAIMLAGCQAMNDITSAGWRPFAAEKMVFSPMLRIAGTIDAIFVRGREMLIVDWKTNKAINRANRYHVHMLPPIEDLDDCEFTHYMLQLNLYQRILSRDGYINKETHPRKMIVHLTPDGYKTYPVDDNRAADTLLCDFLSCDWFCTFVPF